MKTDALFYELFRFDPDCLFELIGLEAGGGYVFESITTKTTEKRMDGYFRSKTGQGENLFAEFQAYPDDRIYWRFFREISTWYEQNDEDRPFTAVVLFTDKSLDPGNCQLSCVGPSRLIVCYLPDLLEELGTKASPLTVLKPLVWEKKEKLPEAVRQWDAEIHSLGLPEAKTKILTELLEYSILQRFSELTLEEVKKMIQLTPLDKTVAGQELIQMGMLKGRKEGRKETALNLLQMKLLTAEQIAKATGLRLSEVNKLKQKMQESK
jgi:predicted transposase YdaD